MKVFTSFRDVKTTPYDRCCTVGDKKLPVFTMGAASYISNADLELNYPFDKLIPNILIGRFSSLAWKLTFSIGHNHRYRNVVSAYDFHWKYRLNAIISQMNEKGTLKNVLPCKSLKTRNNHYQIVIGNDVWIGRGVTILGGVKIGSGAIIGANSTVTKDIPPYAIAAGNPARVVKYRFDEETIKKFMAVKWWNWDIKKILANAYLMNDVEKFLDTYYTPELEKIPEENSIEKYLAEGRKIYTCVGDFHADKPLWRRIISGFCNSSLENAVLIIFLGSDFDEKNVDELKNFTSEHKITGSKIIHGVRSKNGENFSPYILRNSTHFITTREMISLECMDWLWDTDVKIVSALDDGIFGGESDVVWNKIFGS